MTNAIALVDSATQLLNVVEWAHATGTRDVRAVVLQPKRETTRRQLDQVGRLATAAGLAVDTVELRHASGLGASARLIRELRAADQLVIGDPFSRLVQCVLPLVRPDRIVVVDDGTATWQFRDCLDAGRPLLRWRSTQTTSAHAARATRLLSPSGGRELTVFSCLRDTTPFGASALPNDYAWTRSRGVPTVRPGIDVIGASLVETGVVDNAAYLAAVSGLAAVHAPVRYLAHRRESDDGLARIASVPGVQVVRPDLPVELVLRHGPVAEHVIMFPSTVAHTLPIVLRDVPVRLEVRRVEPSWFTSASTVRVRRFVDRIVDDAPLRTSDVA